MRFGNLQSMPSGLTHRLHGFLLLLLLATSAQARQVKPNVSSDSTVYDVVDQMPQLNGSGLSAIVAYVHKHIQLPPPCDGPNRPRRIRIMAEFVITRTGTIRNARILSGTGGMGFDDALLRAINSLPSVEPARRNGVAVNMKLTLPYTLYLQ